MPLRIELVGGRVCLPKFNLDFPFAPPPEGLSQAALGCFAELRLRLAYLTNSSKEEKQEVMQLLTAYGQALFAAVVPPRLQDKVGKERGICIKAKDPALEALPWELLHDGHSFFALTGGVTRAFDGPLEAVAEPHKVLQELGVGLFGYAPLGEAERKRHGGRATELGNRFLTLVEELPLGIWDNQDLKFRVNGQASRQVIVDALQQEQQFVFFSGYDEGDSWLLYGLDSGPTGPNLKDAFQQAAARGLRLLGVNSSSLLLGESPSKYYGFGVPLLLAQSGRMGRKRFKVYFQEFVQGMLREDSILKAHRHALNQLYSELASSWDWAFLRLYLNQKALEAGPDPLRPFTFSPFAGGPQPTPPVRAEILADRPFAGNQEVLSQILRQLLTEQQSRPLWIRSLEGQPQEEYLLEFFRRILAGQNFYWKLLYYRRWGYQEDQKKHLNNQHFGGKFNSLFETGPVLQYFEDSLITMAEGVDRGLQYLTVYYPPDHADPIFETWLKNKQAEGWQVILLSHASFVTDQPTQIISTDSISRREIQEALEDELPEVWEAAMAEGIPPQLRLLPLLKLMARLQEPALWQLALDEEDCGELFRKSLDLAMTKMGHRARQILAVLYLMRVRLDEASLKSLCNLEDVTPALDSLYLYGLIDRDLVRKRYWIPSHLFLKLRQYSLLPKDFLKTQGRDLLHALVQALEQGKGEVGFLSAGFGYALGDLVQLGLLETALSRNLQFARRLALRCKNKPYLIQQHVVTSLEISFLSEDERLKERAFLAALNILEHVPGAVDPVDLLEWYLTECQKNGNWLMVAEILTKLADYYSRQGQQEKAIHALTSALQLSEDLDQHESRYKNLIAIGLLMLEMGETDKVKRLVETHEFDPALVSPEQMASLWLIDALLLFQEHNPAEALHAYHQFLRLKTKEPSPRLRAQAAMMLAKIALSQGDEAGYLKEATKAVGMLEQAGLGFAGKEIHESLALLYQKQENLKQALVHLEWLFHYHHAQGNKAETNQLAHQLGGLFFRVGNQLKSTEYYKIAQGIHS